MDPIKKFQSKMSFEQLAEYAKKLPDLVKDFQPTSYLNRYLEQLAAGGNELDGPPKSGKTTARAIYFLLTMVVLANGENDLQIAAEADSIVHVARRWKSTEMARLGNPIEEILQTEGAVGVISSLTMSANRFTFYVDVKRTTPEQAAAFIEKVKEIFAKNKAKLGAMKFKPLGDDEDFFLTQCPQPKE